MYDTIIIGGGPAGLSAGIYAARGNLNTLILEPGLAGGQMVNTLHVSNYPGVLPEDTGMALGQRMGEQAESFGAKIEYLEALEIQDHGDKKIVVTDDGNLETKTVIIATGAKPRPLGAKGEAEFAGKGVSYCATCDGTFYQDGDVFIIGGGDSAVEEALYMARIARKIYIVHRRDELRAEAKYAERAMNHEKIEILWNTELREIKGEKFASSVVLENNKTGEITEIKAEDKVPFGIFLYVGNTPQTQFLGDLLELNKGYIPVDGNQQTSVPGIFAAGDIVDKRVRQVVNAASEGAMAALASERYIGDLDAKKK
ncbi:MAG: thioredoxin-disulfide reductase [Tissierellia bacterium]|nr:thioredoxin-disulfide reductase [Tissierellia bacterium]